jgi:hypothetical protein
MKILNVTYRKPAPDSKLAREEDWIWELSDLGGNLYYIMDSPFYELHGIENPVHRGHMDSLGEGLLVKAEVLTFDRRSVVTDIINWGRSVV